MGVPRIMCGPGHQCRVEIGEIWELFLVEGQVGAAANLPLKVGRRRNDDIEAAISRQHPSFQRLVGVEIRDVDLDAGEFFERRNGVGAQIIGPDVEVENLFVVLVAGLDSLRPNQGCRNRSPET